jgi:hypothetical protein
MSKFSMIELALCANGNGEIGFNNKFCSCDPEVGHYCRYCAIQHGLNAAEKMIAERDAEIKRLRADGARVVETLVHAMKCPNPIEQCHICRAIVRKAKQMFPPEPMAMQSTQPPTGAMESQ